MKCNHATPTSSMTKRLDQPPLVPHAHRTMALDPGLSAKDANERCNGGFVLGQKNPARAPVV